MKELESFLGIVNYHGQFVNDISTVAEPLNKSNKRRNVPVPWNRDRVCSDAFGDL